MNRYSRHILLSEVGPEGQEKLNTAKVLVIGAGGLGCPVLQYLAAGGIGILGIMDFDVVETSNLQRQVLFGSSSLGENKALAAQTRLKDLNPTIDIKAYPFALNPSNASELFGSYDIIVDGSDNFATRYLVNDTAIKCNKPLVYGAIYKFEGQVSVFNYQHGPSYRCLFPTPPKEGSVANCSDMGVLGVLPGIIGAMQANEVFKIILGFKDVLSGQLFCYNAKTSETHTLRIPRSEMEFQNVLSGHEDLRKDYENIPCGTSVPEITANEIPHGDHIRLIDVRDHHEKPEFNSDNCIRIPLGDIENNIKKISSKHTNIVFCQTGRRSKIAVTLLQKHHIDNCYSLKGGIKTIIGEIKQSI
jgi:adenylyltransferase/sulfurtransferase